jgi:hypothetical protein
MDKSTIHRDATQDTHPHCCWDGLVYIGYTVFDEEVGDDVERIEILPCRRCAELPAER